MKQAYTSLGKFKQSWIELTKFWGLVLSLKQEWGENLTFLISPCGVGLGWLHFSIYCAKNSFKWLRSWSQHTLVITNKVESRIKWMSNTELNTVNLGQTCLNRINYSQIQSHKILQRLTKSKIFIQSNVIKSNHQKYFRVI